MNAPLPDSRTARMVVAQAWCALSRDHRCAHDQPIAQFVAQPVSMHALEQQAYAEWKVARLHAVLGLAEDAVFHARRCCEACRQHRLPGSLIGYACVILAWGLRLLGQADESDHHLHLAVCFFCHIDDPHERERSYDELFAILRGQPFSSSSSQ